MIIDTWISIAILGAAWCNFGQVPPANEAAQTKCRKEIISCVGQVRYFSSNDILGRQNEFKKCLGLEK